MFWSRKQKFSIGDLVLIEVKHAGYLETGIVVEEPIKVSDMMFDLKYEKHEVYPVAINGKIENCNPMFLTKI